MTRSIEVRTSFDKHAVRAGFKANPGRMMVFLALGGVGSDEELNGHADKVLRALGWVPSSEVAVQTARVPEGLPEILREAAKMLGELHPHHIPPSFRYPIVDELYGFAAMVDDLTCSAASSAVCKHEFHWFGDQVTSRRCVHCNVLEHNTAKNTAGGN